MPHKLPRTGLALALSASLALSYAAPTWAQKAPAKAAPAKGPTKAPPPKAPPVVPAPTPDAAAAPPATPVPGPAPAPGKKGAKPPEDDTNKLLEEAQKAAKAGNWEEARTLLVKAYKLRPTWRVAADLGRAEVGVEKWKDGADHLTLALRDKPDDLPEAERKIMETALALAKTHLGVLRVNVAQQGAEVVVGGVVVGTSPLGPVFVDPGPVLVEARLKGYFGLRANKTITAGGEETVDFTLHRDGGAGAVAPPPSSGDRLFRGKNLIVLISGASLAGVLTVMGGVFAVMSNGKATSSHALETAGAPCGAITDCMAQFDTLQGQKVTMAGASMWSFIGAGAVLLGTSTYLTIQLLTKPAATVKTSLVLRPDMVGGSFNWQF